MAPKALLVLTGLLVVALLIVSSDVSAARPVEHEEQQQVTEEAGAGVGQEFRYARGCPGGRCCKWLYARCVRCCRASETVGTTAAGGVGEGKQPGDVEAHAEPHN
uniref:Putative endonuclease C19F8.04c n=1 Tax=Anthurium amnicola TaxID=1678845 RepID=A0A1D1ZEQ7_9ARAE